MQADRSPLCFTVRIIASPSLVRITFLVSPFQWQSGTLLTDSPFVLAGVVMSPYLWTVPQIALGEYTMQLLDDNVLTDTSPVFAITSAAEVAAASTTYPTLSSSVTPITTSMVGTGLGGLASTTTVYWDEPCGCHKTALVPAAASAVASATASAAAGAGGLSGANAAGAGNPNNYTVPAMVTPTSEPYVPGNGVGILEWNWAGLAIAFLSVAFAS